MHENITKKIEEMSTEQAPEMTVCVRETIKEINILKTVMLNYKEDMEVKDKGKKERQK